MHCTFQTSDENSNNILLDVNGDSCKTSAHMTSKCFSEFSTAEKRDIRGAARQKSMLKRQLKAGLANLTSELNSTPVYNLPMFDE